MAFLMDVQHVILANILPCTETIAYLCQRMIAFEVIQTSDQPIFAIRCSRCDFCLLPVSVIVGTLFSLLKLIISDSLT